MTSMLHNAFCFSTASSQATFSNASAPAKQLVYSPLQASNLYNDPATGTGRRILYAGLPMPAPGKPCFRA